MLKHNTDKQTDGGTRLKQVGILYHPLRDKAHNIAAQLQEILSAEGILTWWCSTREEKTAREHCAGTDLVLCIGGDGTILRVARITAAQGIPILGIKLGRLGFGTELSSDEIIPMLPEIIAGKGWIEERIMLESSLGDEAYHCLNDIVVRGATSRLVNVTVYIDGQESMTYRADGMIIATATGSTGYSLAAGGPILNPQSSEFILKPICCHLGPNTALVLLPDSNVQLKLAETDKALLVIDGQIEVPISAGQSVSIKRSPRITRFLRLRQRGYFYKTLWQNLKLPGAPQK